MEETFVKKLPCCMEKVEECLRNNYASVWKDKVGDKFKLRTYVTFKTDCNVSRFITINLKRSHRALFSQFRLGILPLRIETGRFSRTPVEDRICQICNSLFIEDEKHFLLHCNVYNDLRHGLFQSVLRTTPDFSTFNDDEKFCILLESECRATARFIYQAFQKRKSLLYK